jgi:uncharacterized protein (TIGR00730 family)
MRRICVFCSSNRGTRPIYERAARELAGVLVERKLGLVYGGANVGLMGVVADEVLQRGGEAIGVIPAPMVDRELAHRGLSKLHVVATMHERKQLMHDLSDGFLALPGGLGTLEELLETLTWAQLGVHHKPCGVLDVDGYFDPLLALFDRAVSEGLMRSEHRRLLVVDADAHALLDRFAAWAPPHSARWLKRGQE